MTRLRCSSAGGLVVLAMACSSGGGGTEPGPGNPGNQDLGVVVATYLGGSARDQVRDVAVDAQGNVYLTGNSRSPDFPTTAGAYQVSLSTGGSRDSDAFVTKLNRAGQVVWSTYLGGPNFERAYAIEVDGQGFVIIAGRAGENLPVTPGAFQTTFMGSPVSQAYGTQDGFVCKLTPDGSTVVFCSYFGTSDGGIIRDVAVDPQGNIYVAAGTTSGSFPAAWFVGAFQPSRPGGNDIVVAKISPDGSRVLWATFLGGSGNDISTPSIRVAPSGNIGVMFGTHSSDLPVAGQGALRGSVDLYLGVLSPGGDALRFGIYLGGSGNEAVETHGLAVDPSENWYVGGDTDSPDLRTGSGGAQATHGGQTDVFVAKVSSGGTWLGASYLGGSGNDHAEGIGVANGRVFLTGRTSSSDLATSTGRAPSGGFDVLIAVFDHDLSRIRFVDRWGGSAVDRGRGMAVDITGNLNLAGQSISPDFPTLNAVQGTFGGAGDGIFLRYVPLP